MLTTTQGYKFSFEVKTLPAKLVLFNGLTKIILEESSSHDGKFWIEAEGDATKDWAPGKYNFQVLGATGILDKGQIKVLANLEYSDEVEGYWQKVLKAVEDTIAGKATAASQSVTIGDKSITSYSIDQLFKLRDFILKKIAEEEEEETGEQMVTPNDEHRIKYFWRAR